MSEERLKEKINMKLSEKSRELKTANMTNDIFNAIRLQAICNTYIEILKMMGEDNE